MFLVCVFVFSLSIFANADVALSGDGRVPGAPFAYLQQQIDDLKEQIYNLPTGEVKAIAGKQMPNFPPLEKGEPPLNVITLDLPAGDYVSTTTVNAVYFGGPWMETPEYTGWTYSADNPGVLSCKFVDDNGNQLTGHGVGGNVIGQTTLSLTMELHVWNDTIAILQCENTTPWGNYGIHEIGIGQANWTLIKVDYLDEQQPVSLF